MTLQLRVDSVLKAYDRTGIENDPVLGRTIKAVWRLISMTGSETGRIRETKLGRGRAHRELKACLSQFDASEVQLKLTICEFFSQPDKASMHHGLLTAVFRSLDHATFVRRQRRSMITTYQRFDRNRRRLVFLIYCFSQLVFAQGE